MHEHGLVAQWLPLPTQNDEDTRALVRSFLDVFPHAALWTTEFHEMLLIGSATPMVLDVSRIRQRFEQPQVSAALAEVGISSVEAMLATRVTDRQGLERYAGDAQPVTDDRPRIEYAPWVRPREITRVLPALLALRVTPPLENANPSVQTAVDEEWALLHRFYEWSLLAYNGDRQAWMREARALAPIAAENSYMRWFTGGKR
ncbi:hypothetical protein D3C81_1049970 [compost metagenome]